MKVCRNIRLLISLLSCTLQLTLCHGNDLNGPNIKKPYELLDDSTLFLYQWKLGENVCLKGLSGKTEIRQYQFKKKEL